MGKSLENEFGMIDHEIARAYKNELRELRAENERLRQDLTAEQEAHARMRDLLDLLDIKMKLVEQDVAFPSGDKFCLLLSDAFCWASADAEEIADSEVVPLWQLYRDHGEDGLMAWAQYKRGQQIIGDNRDRVTALQQILEKDGTFPLAAPEETEDG